MQLYKNDSQRYLSGLVIIFLIYTGYNIFLGEHGLFEKFKTPIFMQHVILFPIAVLVYWIGTVHLGKLQKTWMLLLWHMVYIGLLSIFLVIILVKLIMLHISFEIRPIHLSDTIKEILISPMLYFSLGLVNRLLIKEPQPV